MKNLVYIGKIIEVKPIPDADRIESATAICGPGGKWMGVVQKGQFKLGDPCQAYLQDSLLPQTPEFAFMEKHHWRVRMARFKGAPSEALILPQTIPGEIGDDVTLAAGVLKYEKPLPANVGGDVLGNFPNFIPRTDEPNFQAVMEMVAALRGKLFYSTLKADGSSGTVYRYKDHFGVCSRNLELKQTNGNAFWQCALAHHLETELQEGYALQFECVGPGIQKNPLGLQKVEPRFFNLYDIQAHAYLGINDLIALCAELDLPMVDLIEMDRPFEFSDDQLRLYAERIYVNGKQAEGIVVRPMVEETFNGDRLSFKVLNLRYKD